MAARPDDGADRGCGARATRCSACSPCTLLRGIRLIDARTMANVAGAVMRRVGPWLPEHRIGRANLTAAFPEKSPAEIETILRGVWDNLGRVGAEFAHIDRLWDYDPSRTAAGPHHGLRRDRGDRVPAARRRQAGAHLHRASGELGARRGRRAMPTASTSTVLYRRPNVAAISDAVIGMRAGCMGTLIPTSTGAPQRLLEALQRGVACRHAGRPILRCRACR